MILTRRRFLEIVAVLSSASFPAMASASPTLLRSLPNPHTRHLTIAGAEKLCEAHARHQTFDDRCLNLQQFQTASLDALYLLSQHDWWFAEFGLREISREMACALSCISVGAIVTFHHLEKVSPTAVASLIAAWEQVAFDNVSTLDSSSVRVLADLTNDVADCADRQISFTGNFRIDHTLANALAQLPLGLRLSSQLTEGAFDSGSTQALSRHLGPWMMISEIMDSSNTLEATVFARVFPFSTEFINALSSNPSKRLKIHPPRDIFDNVEYDISLDDRDFREN